MSDDYIELDFLQLSEETVEPMLENDEISSSEAGFLRGYLTT